MKHSPPSTNCWPEAPWGGAGMGEVLRGVLMQGKVSGRDFCPGGRGGGTSEQLGMRPCSQQRSKRYITTTSWSMTTWAEPIY